MSREEQLIKAAGGEYIGVQDGLAYFNEPKFGSSMVVTMCFLAEASDEVAVMFLKMRMAQKRREFVRGKAGTRVGPPSQSLGPRPALQG